MSPKLTGPLFSVEARKELAKAITYQRRPGGASVYGYKKPKVPLTAAQLYQRHTIYAAVVAWKYAHADLKAYYETIAQGQGQSGYSLWMHERAFKCGGAVLYLPMVECAGAVVHDVSGKGNDGDIVGATWQKLTDKSWCLDFNGVNNYITLPDHDEFSFGDGSNDSPLTMFVWANPSAQAVRLVVAKYNNTGTLREWQVWLDATDHLTFDIFDESVDKRGRRKADATISEGVWQFWAITYDGRGGDTCADGITLYVDGSVMASTANNQTGYVAMENLVTAPMIGDREVASIPFKGTIGEVAIFRRELNAIEIQNYCLATKWRFG